MRRFSKSSADRVASVRIDLLPQQETSTPSPPTDGGDASSRFKALVSSQAVVASLESSMQALFGLSACAITLSGANIATRELAVHVHAAGGGGSSTCGSAFSPSGVDQLRAACALVTALPISQRTTVLFRKAQREARIKQRNDLNNDNVNSGENDEGREKDDADEESSSREANDLLRFVAQVGESEWVLPCRLTVSRVQ